MALIDRIKYDGTSIGDDWLVYKYPSEQFVFGSQLVVNNSQEALFYKGGKVFDLFGAGTHTLATGNMPLLNKLVNRPFGGNTPFTAEIYYINKTVKTDLKWGTATPIPLEDPKYGIILNIGARGQYGISINNSRLFVTSIIGAVQDGALADYQVVLRYFNGLINTKIKNVTSEYMIRKRISFLEITAYLSELSVEFQKELGKEFDRFGIEVINFYCESIAPRPEDYIKLCEYKEKLLFEQKNYIERNAFVICQQCGEKNGISMVFCVKCGNRLDAPMLCPNCGKSVTAEMRFCGQCGKKL